MRCREFNRLLNESRVRDRLHAKRRDMDAHCMSCPRCAAVWEAERMLRAMVVPATPPTLLERICAFVDDIVVGTVIPFPVRPAILIACLVLAGAAAATVTKLVILDRLDAFGDGGLTAPISIEAGAPEDTSDPTRFRAETDPGKVEDTSGSAIEQAEQLGSHPERSVELEPAALLDTHVDDPELVAGLDKVTGNAGDSSELRPGEGTESAIADASPIAEQKAVALPRAASIRPSGWLDTRAEIDELMAVSDFEAAAGLAELLLKQTRAKFGDPSAELVNAEMLVASVLRFGGNYLGAEKHIVDAINALDNIESAGHSGPAGLTPLIDALLYLGDTYDMIDEHELALEVYARARGISRREQGFLTIDEITIVERMTNAYLALGAIGEAQELQRNLLTMTLTKFGADSLEAVAAYHRYARWLRDHARESARMAHDVSLAYSDARGIIGRNFLDGDPELAVRLLLTHTHEMLFGGLDWGRESIDLALRQLLLARRKYHSNKLEDPLLLAAIARDIGDWCIFAGAYYSDSQFSQLTRADRGALSASGSLPGRGEISPLDAAAGDPRGALRPAELAAANYREAWDALGRLPNGDALREDWFGKMVSINAPFIDSQALTTDPVAPMGSVELEFELDVFGRASEVHVVRSEPSGLADNLAIRWVQASQFRPRIIDGRTVLSNARLVWTFRYDPAQIQLLTANR